MTTKTKPTKPAAKRGRGRPVGSTGKHRRPRGGSSAGTISDNESLRIDAFCERMAMSRVFLRRMADEGLPIRKVGRYRFISGKDFNEFIASRPCTASPHIQSGDGGQVSESTTTASGEGSV